MRKQRKMGHITVVGPSMGIVEARVKSFLKEESEEEIPGMFSMVYGITITKVVCICQKLRHRIKKLTVLVYTVTLKRVIAFALRNSDKGILLMSILS